MAVAPEELQQLQELLDPIQVQPDIPAESGQAQTAVELDLSQTAYSMVALLEGVRATVPCSGLAWEEQTGEIATRITATFPDDVLEDGRRLANLIQLGTEINVLAALGDAAEFKEVVRGKIEEIAPNDGTGGTFEIIAYEPVKTLLNSKVNRFFEAGRTAADIVKELCSEHGITIELHPIFEQTPLQNASVFHGKTLAEILTTIVAQIQVYMDEINERLVIRSRDGSLTVMSVGNNKPVYWLDQGVPGVQGNITSVRERFSITDLVTRVIVTGNPTLPMQTPEVVTLDAIDQRYGIRTEMVGLRDYATPDKIRADAQKLLNERGQPRHERSIVAPDIPMIRKYDQIRVTAGTLNGMYLVESIIHDENSRLMTISLGNLKFTPVDGTFSVLQEENIPPERTGGVDGDFMGLGPISDSQLYALAKAAGFTGQDAEIAVAISLSENSSSDPNAKGGPNKNGTYDLGLWQINQAHWPKFGGEAALRVPLNNAKAAYAIWKDAGGSWRPWATYPTHYQKNMDRARRAAKAPPAQIPTPQGAYTRQGASGLPNSALSNEMSKWAKVPWEMGGTTKKGVDCSSMVQQIYGALGVSLPRTANQQWAATRRVPTPEFGDLVFFQGTYNTPGASHVGIYIGNGMMYSAVEPHVKQDSINSPYWKAHLMGFGRVSR